jgi:hypothetical protein
MCDKCKEFDVQIARYRRLEVGVTDQRTLDGIKELLELANSKKAALHRGNE